MPEDCACAQFACVSLLGCPEVRSNVDLRIMQWLSVSLSSGECARHSLNHSLRHSLRPPHSSMEVPAWLQLFSETYRKDGGACGEGQRVT